MSRGCIGEQWSVDMFSSRKLKLEPHPDEPSDKDALFFLSRELSPSLPEETSHYRQPDLKRPKRAQRKQSIRVQS